MNTTSRRVLAALALTSALTVSGCATMSTIQTDVPYAAGDGVNLTLGPDVDVRGLLVVGGEKAGGPGRISGQLLNATDKSVTVSFATPDGSSVKTDVPAHTSANLADEDLILKSVPGQGGDLVTVTVTSAADGANVIQVPIMLAEGAYAKYAPTS